MTPLNLTTLSWHNSGVAIKKDGLMIVMFRREKQMAAKRMTKSRTC
uniref:Uncharacterized protein n=1 Tax=Salmonella sp. TaxID=599 RepID=A0A482ETX0_SALSP|nr:hypothetical protein NNIBIDOC_00177 [Salmonella sp.]